MVFCLEKVLVDVKLENVTQLSCIALSRLTDGKKSCSEVKFLGYQTLNAVDA